MMSTRASVTCSRIHLASQTMIRLLPLPCVCQMMPPSRRVTMLCAARTPKYWLWRQSLLHPGVEHHEVMDQFQQARLAAELHQRPVERIFDRGRAASFHVR